MSLFKMEGGCAPVGRPTSGTRAERDDDNPAVMRPTPAPTGTLNIDRRTALTVIGAILMAVGSIGPWITGLGGLVSVSGTSGDGVISLICAAIIVTVALVGQARWVGILAAVVATAVGGIDLVNVISRVSDSHGLGQVGWGIVLVPLAGLLVLASYTLARRPAPDITPPPAAPPAWE
jgi:hypothetical protein